MLKSSMLESASRIGRFAAHTRGNVALIFALVMPMLILVTVGGVDIHRAATVRSNLQDALDAASLAAARSRFVTEEDLTRVGLASLKANLKAYPNIALREDDVTFVLTDDAVIIADAIVDVDAIVANIILPPYGKFLDETIPVSSHSEVNRSSKNIEVAMVLDITGSMSGSRIVDLKAAANDLIDIVVQDVQTPYYTRMAIVPYSMGVNLGGYADGARGALIQPKAITNITWSTGSVKTITAANRANGTTITANSHGFSNGDTVAIWDSAGMTQLNGVAFTVSDRTTNSFRINADSRNWSSFTGQAKVAKCARSDCHPTVTVSGHGLASTSNGTAYLADVGGMTQLNDRGFLIDIVNNNSFRLRTVGARVYSSGGLASCGQDGCWARVFNNMYGSVRGLPSSTCVSERAGSEATSDQGPTLAKVGRNYPSLATGGAANPCPTSVIQPLTSNKQTLTSLVDGMTIGGSTAGQIGIAWGWYAISPNFNSLWSGSPAGPYEPDKTVKAVIIMTDGEFNTPYNAGVIAKNAGTGSGDNNYKIDANGADPFSRSEAMCDAMKAQGVVVYTVGFQIAEDGDAAELMADCATSEKHVFLPETGGDLSEAFAAIGRDITRLRISR